MLVGRTLALQVLTAGVTVLLARLLTPTDYGLFAVALAVQLVGQQAAELGLPASLIRLEEDPTPRQQSAVGGVLLATSTAVSAALLLAAFVVAPTFGGSRVLEMIAVSSSAIPFYAARAVPMVLMERKLRFGRVAIVETAETLAFNGFALGAAFAGLGAFSLAGAVPVGGLAGVVAAWAMQPFIRRPTADLEAVRPLAGFGLRVSGLQGIYLLRELGLVVTLTAIGGVAIAGFYAMGKRLFSFPLALTSAVARVSFPALARDATARPSRAAKAVAYAAIVAGLPLALVAGAVQPLIVVVLGNEWLPTTDVVLAGSLGMMVTASANAIMIGFALAEGRPNAPLVAGAAETALAISLVAILTNPMGETGVGLAITASALVSAVVLAASTHRLVRHSLLAVAKASLIAAAAAGTAQLVVTANDIGGLLVSLGLTGAVWLALGMILSRADLSRVAQLARPLRRRGRTT